MKTNKSSRNAVRLLIFVLGFGVTAYSQSFLTNGLVAYYPFDGNANDASGNGNDGTVSGATLTEDRFGADGHAYLFNGASSMIRYPETLFGPADPAWTVSAWITTDGGPYVNVQQIFAKSSYNGGMGLGIVANSILFGVHIGYPQTNPEIYTPLRVNSVMHVVGVYEKGQSISLYVDGVLRTNMPVSSESLTVDTGFPLISSIGAYDYTPSPYMHFRGVIDDVRVYTRALSAIEVGQLYAYESKSTPSPYLDVSIQLTIFKQNTNNDNGLVTVTAPPKISTYATRDILNVLAFDENLEGNWPSNSFPKGARLAVKGSNFLVMNGTNILLNASDILSINMGENEISSGTQDDATGLASHIVQTRRIARITFDDTFIAGGKNLKFNLQGLLSLAKTDTTPAAGTYTEVRTAKIINAAGEGLSQNVPFVCTGSVTASGRGLISP